MTDEDERREIAKKLMGIDSLEIENLEIPKLKIGKKKTGLIPGEDEGTTRQKREIDFRKIGKAIEKAHPKRDEVPEGYERKTLNEILKMTQEKD